MPKQLILLFVFACSLYMPAQAITMESDVFDPVQYKSEIVVPTLQDMDTVFPGASHPAAVNLMIGIAYHESKGGTYLRQKGNSGGVVQEGGLGINQIEAATHQSVYNHYLRYRTERIEYAMALLPVGSIVRIAKDEYEIDDRPLVHDLRYNTFIARVRIYKESFNWPADPDDTFALGKIWDDQYNRNPSAGFVHQYVRNFPRVVLG